MVLIREHEQFARHLLSLQDVERGQALGDGEAVVQLAVDDLQLFVLARFTLSWYHHPGKQGEA